MRIFFSALSTLALLALPVLGGEQLLPQEPRVSDRLQAVMRLDHEFSLALQANSSAAAQLGMAPKSLKMPTSYNEQVADKLFLLSATAYCTDNDNLRDWTCNSCGQFGEFTVTKIMDDTTNQGYVGYFTGGLPGPPVPGTPVAANEPFVVVGFRGTVTSDLKDWIEDLSFAKQTPWSANNPNVHVHEGFFQAYMDMRPAMLDGLDKAFSASGARTLLGVGHSLGAAMAELAALDLKLNYYPNKYYATYTQGTPRPGDQGFADLYNSAIDASFREIHQADLVPHLPPMLLGFKHGPTEVWFNEDWNSYKVCSGSNGEDGSCSDSVVLPVSINDHTHYRGVEVAGLCTNNAKMLNIKPLPTPNQSGAAKPQQQPQEEAAKQQHKKAPHILTE